MDRYINGHELIKRLKIYDHEFLHHYIIKKGLQPYNLSPNPYPPPNIRIIIYEKRQIESEISDKEKYLGRLYEEKKKIEEHIEKDPDISILEGEHNEALIAWGYKEIIKTEEERQRDSAENREANENLYLSVISRIERYCIEIQAKRQKVYSLEQEIKEKGGLSWKNYCLPDSDQEIMSIINELLNCLYKLEDVESLKEEQLQPITYENNKNIIVDFVKAEGWCWVVDGIVKKPIAVDENKIIYKISKVVYDNLECHLIAHKTFINAINKGVANNKQWSDIDYFGEKDGSKSRMQRQLSELNNNLGFKIASFEKDNGVRILENIVKSR